MAKAKKAIKIPTMASMSKKYGGSGLGTKVLEAPMLWLPCKFLAVNYQFGGGIPYGKILELFGTESGGKTLLALDFAYATQQLGGIVIWADAEKSFTKEWAEANGLDMDKIWLYKENTIEKISDWVRDSIYMFRSQLVNNEPILLVLDSLAALECEANQNTEQLDRKAEMGNRAKGIGTFLRGRNPLLDEFGICTILVNQLRSKVGASKYEDPDTTPGGEATKFFADIRAGVYGGGQILKKIKGKETRVGRLSTIRIKKNKVAPPRDSIKKAEVYFNPDYTKMPIGFNRYFGLEEIILSREILLKQGNKYSFRGKVIATKKDGIMEAIMENDDLRRKIIRKLGINSIGTLQKKLDSLETNLFPVKVKKDKDEDNNDEK